MSERTQAVTVDVRFDDADTPPAQWDWAGLLDTDVLLAESNDPEPSDDGFTQRLTLVVSFEPDDGVPSEWEWSDLADTEVAIVDADEVDDDDADV